jgi:hypothetical protein
MYRPLYCTAVMEERMTQPFSIAEVKTLMLQLLRWGGVDLSVGWGGWVATALPTNRVQLLLMATHVAVSCLCCPTRPP